MILRVRDHLIFYPIFSICQFAKYGIEAEFGQAAFRRIWSYRLFVQEDPLARVEIIYVVILVFRGSNPVPISASLRLQFKKYIYVQDKETALTRLGIISRDSVFVNLINLEKILAFLHGHSHFFKDPRTCQRTLGDRLVHAFTMFVELRGTRLA